MSNSSRPRLSRHTFRGTFKQLIENLRKQTDFKQINAQTQPNSLPLRSFNQQEMIQNDILPITQSPPENSLQENHSIISNSTAIGKIKAEIISSSKDGSILEDGTEGNFDEENSQFLVNQITDLLKPSQRMRFDKKQGRTGVIMRQRFRQSKRQPFILPRYTKVPRQMIILAQQNPIQPSPIKKNTFKQINQVSLIDFWNVNNKLTSKSTTEQIYLYFSSLLQQLSITVSSPTIKRYNTCIYFGQDTKKSEKYEGIIYYFDKKVYYGQLYNGTKHGEGVQINFDQGITCRGKFQNGKKNGIFRVQKERENYEGQLEHGLYHGKGILMTSQYKYEGFFQNGNKHGLGQEIYPKTGLVLKGYFKNGQFQNIDISKQKADPSSEGQIKIKPQKILLKNHSYDIDFQLQQTFKRQILPSSHQNLQHQQDSKSLYDLLTRNKKINKYDFDTTQKNQKFPKIRIEGLNFGFKHPNYQNQQQQRLFSMSKNLIAFQKSRQQIPIRKRYHSQQQKQGILYKNLGQQQARLGRHKNESPLRTNK